MTTLPVRRHALAETAAAYAADTAPASHAKLSISLPADLAEQVRLAATESGTSVSAVIAAALRRSIAAADQERLDAAIEAQNDENLEFAQAYVPIAARLWAELEW